MALAEELALVPAAEEAEAEEAAPDPVPAMTLPWSSTAATAAKFVLIPKTALKAWGLSARETRRCGIVKPTISLSASLHGLTLGGRNRRRTSSLSSRIGGAGVGQSIANELGDDVDVLSRAMVERGWKIQSQFSSRGHVQEEAHSCQQAQSWSPCDCRSQHQTRSGELCICQSCRCYPLRQLMQPRR